MSAAAMTPVAVEPFELARHTGDLTEGVAAMRSTFREISLAGLVTKANRTARHRGSSAAFAGLPEKPVDWYGFDAKDNATINWYPQGIACASEAGRDDPLLVVSWYWKPAGAAKEKGVRLSFLDTSTRKYVHVLLVRPKADGSYGPINIHAGGISWCGDLIYVADTAHGMRVFDLNNIFDLSPAHGRYLGYRYILPQTDHWRPVRAGARFSFASVDRTTSPATLVSGEYVEPGDTGRVARWALGGEGVIDAGADDVAIPVDVYQMPVTKVQGAHSNDGTWYLSQARDSHENGALVVIGPDGDKKTRKLPIGSEDLTCCHEKEVLWSLTEFKNMRVLFAVGL
jgi:hypothetical protein